MIFNVRRTCLSVLTYRLGSVDYLYMKNDYILLMEDVLRPVLGTVRGFFQM